MGVLWMVLQVAVLSILLNGLGGLIIFLNFGHHFHTQWPGPCRKVQGFVVGAEDAEIVSGDLALVTSGNCFLNTDAAKVPGCGDYKGTLYTFDFNSPDVGAKEVKIAWKTDVQGQKARDFHPHGMTIWHGASPPIVMVVNHDKTLKETIEIFTFDEKSRTLTHQDSISIPEVTLFNDVKATGPRSFYFTNYMRFPFTPVLRHIEELLRLPLGWVGHYDGQTGKTQVVVPQGEIFFANGIQMSPDGKYIYVSNIGQRAIDVFNRHENNSLTMLKRLPINTVADNLSLDPTNSAIWIGSVPVVWKTAFYLDNPTTEPCPSQVLKLELKDGVPTGQIQQVYSGNDELPGIGLSSVGLYHNKKLFIGSVHGAAAVCDVLYDN